MINVKIPNVPNINTEGREFACQKQNEPVKHTHTNSWCEKRMCSVCTSKSIMFLWHSTVSAHRDWLPFLPCTQSYHNRFNILKNQLVVLRITTNFIRIYMRFAAIKHNQSLRLNWCAFHARLLIPFFSMQTGTYNRNESNTHNPRIQLIYVISY